MKSNIPVKKIKGKVVSDKMDKTIVVLIERIIKHKRYGKYIKKSNKISVHDARNKAKIGDLVECIETLKVSKKKSWILNKILKKFK
ncbi:30S ribosomal protein S17 [Candidatus Portiera aleyrodidarum]|uniref:Small ribosomal subunit protein uS17 n=1 Tax=Candidatus Portiera aleyrodidarum TaxID=91844 RepID=A0A8D9JSE7_9GAMM|nr:30S ribosomal protein S17 [Candidatus Portiera aleyrodidarum]CEI58691.1 30S ribosomal protein S17 [Candidatus Portiera aleyrodidarum]CEL12384.1 30S ribosomal protein S17 [Candidatus Portiera aleyrodidarum]